MNTTNSQIDGQATKTQHLKIVLNGGSDQMESATIPFQWFFSNEVIEKQPTHLLVIDQNERQFGNDFTGERSFIPIERGSTFLQFHSPGRHHLAFIAVKFYRGSSRCDSEKECRKRFLELRNWKMYANLVPWSDWETKFENTFMGWSLCAATIIEVEVPQDFFARKPENALGKAFWNWVNLWHSAPPRDECDFRRRMMIAFTVQPFVMALGKLFQFFVYAPLCSLYLILGRIVNLFIGFRPPPLFAGFHALWQWQFNPYGVDWKLRRFGYGSYRVWADSSVTNNWTPRYMPVTGSEVLFGLFVCLLVAIAAYDISWVIQNWFVQFSVLITPLFLFLGYGFFGLILFLCILKTIDERFNEKKWYRPIRDRIDRISVWFAEKETKQKTQKEQAAKQKRETKKEPPFLYFEWLREKLPLSKAPERVEIKNLPPAFRNRPIQKFRMAYGYVKSLVCRPFAE